MNGTRNRGDVCEIFAWIRHRHQGNPLVKEIGDLFAHADERNQGVAWSAARDFYLTLNMKLRFEPFRTTLQCEPNDLASFSKGARAGLRRIGRSRCRELTGIAYQQAEQRLEAALSKITDIEDSRLVVNTPLTTKESEALHRIISHIVATPAIDQDELREQLVSSLLANDVLGDWEAALLHSQFEYVAACIIREMHGVKILLGDGMSGRLSAAVDPQSPTRLLYVGATVPAPGGKIPGIVFPLFRSTCAAATWCDAALHAYSGLWDDLVLDISSGILTAGMVSVAVTPAQPGAEQCGQLE